MVEQPTAETTANPVEMARTRRLLFEILVPGRKELGVDQSMLAQALGMARTRLDLFETGELTSSDPFFPDKYFNALVTVWTYNGLKLKELGQRVTEVTSQEHLEVKFP